jgi:hypothetical protein
LLAPSGCHERNGHGKSSLLTHTHTRVASPFPCLPPFRPGTATAHQLTHPPTADGGAIAPIQVSSLLGELAEGKRRANEIVAALARSEGAELAAREAAAAAAGELTAAEGRAAELAATLDALRATHAALEQAAGRAEERLAVAGGRLAEQEREMAAAELAARVGR